jgi:thioesterase domain-containing protein
VSAWFRQAQENGRPEAGLALLRAVAGLRPTFTGSAELTRPIRGVRLARGAADPHVVCIPALVAMAGVRQYARLAAHFLGSHDVSAIPVPGFGPGESLPATFAALVAVTAEAVLRHTDGGPFVLLGSSTGGLLAHAIAAELEDGGVVPAGVALLDPYLMDSDFVTDAHTDLVRGLTERNERFAEPGSAGLSAMAWCFRLMEDWRPTGIVAPTLLVRATEPMTRAQTGTDWQSRWASASAVADVPGNHFTMAEEHAETTAEAVLRWLN